MGLATKADSGPVKEGTHRTPSRDKGWPKKLGMESGAGDCTILVGDYLKSLPLGRNKLQPGMQPSGIPSKKWQPIPVFLSGKFHGQRSLAGYSPWGHKESNMTEHMSTRM